MEHYVQTSCFRVRLITSANILASAIHPDPILIKTKGFDYCTENEEQQGQVFLPNNLLQAELCQ